MAHGLRLAVQRDGTTAVHGSGNRGLATPEGGPAALAVARGKLAPKMAEKKSAGQWTQGQNVWIENQLVCCGMQDGPSLPYFM